MFNNELRITGDATGDRLDLIGFTDSGTDQGAFDVYTGNFNGHNVSLLVDQDISQVNVA